MVQEEGALDLMPADKHPLYVIGSGGGDLVDGSGGDFGGALLGTERQSER